MKTAEKLCLGFRFSGGGLFCKGLNRYLSKTRYVVEQSFGTLHRKFRYARAAYFGLIKVSAQSHLKAMCLNLLKAANRLSVPVAA